MFYHFISHNIFNRCAELWVLYKYQKIVTERMICHNFEKNMGQVLHCNTSFNSRLNRKCKVQLMISLSKDRDIQLLQHPLIFILWLSNKLLWGLVAAAEICWKISEILQATGIREHIWTFLRVIKSLDFKKWCILVLNKLSFT